MSDVVFGVSGIAEAIRLMQAARRNLLPEVGQEIYKFGEEVMTDSKQVVPVKTGALMNTGKVMPPKVEGSAVTVELGYGDESVNYALVVHEEVNLTKGSPANSKQGYVPPHPINWTRPGSGPKYLENPLKAKQDQLAPRLKTVVENTFKK